MPDDTSSIPSAGRDSSAPTISGHPAVDLAAAIFRSYGRYLLTAEDATGDLEDQCEQWARHLLVGSPAPGIASKANGGSDERSWQEARRFFNDMRRGEQERVETRFKDFRDMLWLFMHGIRDSFIKDQTADKEVEAQLNQLQGALESDSIDDLKREVMGSVVIIGRTIQERARRQEQQMYMLGAQLKDLHDELVAVKQEMSLDALTRLYNRASLDQMAERIVALSQWSGQAACLLMVDVDGFKKINDNYGHPAGDAALSMLARAMLRTFPRKGDFVSRYAGDEFAIILQDTSAKEGMLLAERLLMVVRTTVINLSDQEIDFTVSIGIAELRNGDTMETWLRRADAGLYSAKQAGRNRVVFQDGA